MSRQRLLAAALAWLAVVASVSALVWLVISQAGADLVASDGAPSTARAASVAVAPTPAAAQDRSTAPQPSNGGGSSPSSDAASESPTVPASPTPDPAVPSSSPVTTRTPSADAQPSGTAESPTSSPSPSDPDVRRTWQGQAGTVVAACGSSGIRLVSAQPANGFKVEVHTEGSRLEAEFEGREDERGAHAKVTGLCVDGAPSFSVESDED